ATAYRDPSRRRDARMPTIHLRRPTMTRSRTWGPRALLLLTLGAAACDGGPLQPSARSGAGGDRPSVSGEGRGGGGGAHGQSGRSQGMREQVAPPGPQALAGLAQFLHGPVEPELVNEVI